MPKTFHTPALFVYPVEEFESASPEASSAIAALRDVLQKRPADAEVMPFLPLFNAAQQMHFGVRYVPFAGGQGVRYVTQYAQGIVPVNNNELFYTFQGLTADDRFYVAAILPVSHDTLPARAESVSQSDLEALAATYANYIKDTVKALAAQPETTFIPNLAELDVLAGSITVRP